MTTHNSIADTGGYYIVDDSNKIAVYEQFNDAVRAVGTESKLRLDITALSEVPSHYTFIGDKTIIKNIKRTPWFSKYNPEQNFFEYNLPLFHGDRKADAKEIAIELHLALRKEISLYLKESRRVGILLSGGMDSRVVSSVLKEIQNERKNFEVIVFCWGDAFSRDPIYASRIAELYDWNFQHFPITYDTLRKNIEICADEGCFYSPKHLHALTDVSRKVREMGVECLLAGSYGDSIGRAEYSGIRVDKLRPVNQCLRNWFGLFNNEVYRECKKRSISDIDSYHAFFNQSSKSSYNEFDYQIHYMRNMLGTCMSILNKDTEFHQVFTHNSVVSLMWSFANECRTNEVYKHLLCRVDSRLLDIPWARTGRKYLDNSLKADGLSKSFHSYSEWVRHDLFLYIQDLIFNGEIEKTGIFNMDQIYFIMMQNRKLNIENGRIEEIILWLSSLSIFLKNNEWEIDFYGPQSSMCSFLGRIETILYLGRHRLKNIHAT